MRRTSIGKKTSGRSFSMAANDLGQAFSWFSTGR
jgi:hypothetical protein